MALRAIGDDTEATARDGRFNGIRPGSVKRGEYAQALAREDEHSGAGEVAPPQVDFETSSAISLAVVSTVPPGSVVLLDADGTVIAHIHGVAQIRAGFKD